MMQNEDKRLFVYRIDHQDRISYVNKAWIDFGVENGLTDFSEEKVIGRLLWGFIADHSVMGIYKNLFDTVRAKKSRPKIPYRCDSPDCRRFMQMELSASHEGEIKIVSEILKLEFRPSVALLEQPSNRSDKILAVCSVCKKVQLREDTWYEIEDATAILGITNEGPYPKLSQKMCGACFKECNKNVLPTDL